MMLCNVPIACIVRNYGMCCPPSKSSCGTGSGCGGSRTIPQPSPKCRPGGNIAPNPCVPRFHHGEDTWKKYKYIALFVCVPLIFAQALNALSHGPPHKEFCRDYEYMRIRSKRFPWGDGVKSFFHNDHVNFLPGECEPPPLDCDD